MTDDRILGCVLGGALGDALGLPYEGRSRVDLVEWPKQLRVSDDTQLTLATCEGIVASQGKIDPAAIASSMARWFKESRLIGLGASSYKALSELAVGGHWALVGRKGERAAGNGAAMRIAPLAFVLDPKDFDDRIGLRDVCRITHHSEEAYVGALAVALAVHMASTGEWNGERNLLDRVTPCLPDSRVRDRLEVIRTQGRDFSLPETADRWGASGYVVESVPLALCGAERVLSVGFESTLEELVRCGGDTDTVASLTGQVAGAFLGAAALPADLMARLVDYDLIHGDAIDLARVLG